jgi:hypothetical protein
VTLVFFLSKQLLLVPLVTPRKDLEFFQIFKELFVSVIDSRGYPPVATYIHIVDGQARLDRLKMDNFCLFLDQQMDKRQTSICAMRKR